MPHPSLMEKLREENAASDEISQSDSTGAQPITMGISKFEIKLSLLVNCYRESLRLCKHTVCNRRIMEDMTITDHGGQSYLLKKGADIQLPAGVTHRDTSSWGSDAEHYRCRSYPQGSLHVLWWWPTSVRRKELCIFRDHRVRSCAAAGL